MLIDISSKKFLVVGDLIVDYYRVLRPERVSPEAPVLVFLPDHEYKSPGGAANVANNLLALGAKPDNVVLCSIVGDDFHAVVGDPDGFMGCRHLLIRQPGRLTTVKERLITKRQQLARIDRQSRQDVDSKQARALCDQVLAMLPDTSAIVFSDYQHGVMLPSLVSPVIRVALASKIPTVVDSKSSDTMSKYKGATVALPNSVEARRMSGHEGTDEDMAKFMLSKMRLDAIAITLGAKGIMLCEAKGDPRIYPPLDDQSSDEVVDVTGAGDTVTAMMAAALGLGMPYDSAVKLANVAAGLVIKKLGVATTTVQEISQVMAQRGMIV